MGKFDKLFPRLDASESAFFSRQLEHIRPMLFEVQYAKLKGRLFVPVNNNVHQGAEEFTYRWYDEVGAAKLIKDYSDDLPRVDILGTEASVKIKAYGDAYGYSFQEARAAMMAGLDLDPRKARAARNAIERQLDTVMLLGDADAGTEGLFNLSTGTTSYTPTTTVWTAATDPDLILNELHGIENQIVEDTLEIEAPNTLALPLSTYNLIKSLRMGLGDGAMTVLQVFLQNATYVKTVESSIKLESNAAWTGKRMVCYDRNADKLEAIIPQEFEQFAPQEKGLEVVTNCHARTGGVVAYFPGSVAYGDNI